MRSPVCFRNRFSWPSPPPAPANRRSRRGAAGAGADGGGVDSLAWTMASLAISGGLRATGPRLAAEGAGGRTGGVQQDRVEVRGSFQVSAVHDDLGCGEWFQVLDDAAHAARRAVQGDDLRPQAASCRVLPRAPPEVEGGFAGLMSADGGIAAAASAPTKTSQSGPGGKIAADAERRPPPGGGWLERLGQGGGVASFLRKVSRRLCGDGCSDCQCVVPAKGGGPAARSQSGARRAGSSLAGRAGGSRTR